VFRPAPYLCVLPRNESPFPTPLTAPFTILFRSSQLSAHTVTCRALRHSLGTVRRCSFAPLNLHKARVRRNRGRLPSSRCIESARTHRARAGALPLRASDTSLTTPAGSRVFAPDLLSFSHTTTFYAICAPVRRMIRRNWRFHSCPTYFARPRVTSSIRCCPPNISSVTVDHDGLFELPACQGGG